MVLFTSLVNGLARTVSLKRGKNSGKEDDDGRKAVEELAKEAKKSELLLRSSGSVRSQKANTFASVFSKRGRKGTNQDCLTVWEEFGCQDDMMFCGIFDGHGPWGHFVAKRVRELVPASLLCHWQQTLAATSLDLDFKLESDRNLHWFDTWKQSYLKTCASVDQDLKNHAGFDSFRSGTTALTIIKQGELLAIANLGDSRAVLGAASEDDDGTLIPLQLTTDLKPNLPEEAERIKECRGKVVCMEDEPGVYRVWMPNGKSPGLAISRAFGDYCVKEFGLISEPHLTHRTLTSRDHFLILATDGVWDVISNEEAVDIVSSTPQKEKAAQRLVECAVHQWKRKRRSIAMDDMSAICLFFHSSSSSSSSSSSASNALPTPKTFK